MPGYFVLWHENLIVSYSLSSEAIPVCAHSPWDRSNGSEPETTEFILESCVLKESLMISESDKAQLIEYGEAADRLADWPTESWQALKRTGALRWSIPQAFGGEGLTAVEILKRTEEIAASCLTTAFILSQREAGVRQLLKGPERLKARFLPALANGELFLTVGLSQLSTSRQHLSPSMRATRTETGEYRLDGEIPWVTGADQAEIIIVGATLDDLSQILVVLKTQDAGVSVDKPMPLSALMGSRTSLVHCDAVEVDAEMVLAGPTENVLGKVGGGGLETSCLAIGLAGSAIHFIQQEARKRPDLSNIATRLDSHQQELRERLHQLAVMQTPDSNEVLLLRTESSKHALRSTQAALMIAKGGGFVAPHPAQRWARQALFFLVWSCPRAVAEGVLSDLVP